jgi:hypothetical protein
VFSTPRWILGLSFVVCVVGSGACGGDDRRPESARDVQRRLLREDHGLLAHPRRVSCRRDTDRFWLCSVIPRRDPDALAEAMVTVEVRVLVRGVKTGK